MADKDKKKKRRSRGGRGGGRWGVDMNEAGLSLVSGTVGKMVAGWIAGFENLPEFLTKAEPSDVGLYALGVLFRRRSLRSVGAGLILSRSILIGG